MGASLLIRTAGRGSHGDRIHRRHAAQHFVFDAIPSVGIQETAREPVRFEIVAEAPDAPHEIDVRIAHAGEAKIDES